ncbi:hypothetical protein WL68_29540 [Burkholderia cepacia]|nr:hypothetical protein WK70_16870 [Burkholderia cepacia]KVX59049.1 hypothetical protein WL06_06335 [Burkholderia cepacia]KWD56773.1 hypothetical protein WL68_29540 [Burkholderia cepacia]OUE36477.1 hypothetical protein BZY94_40460 [Burkholderia territorii]RQT25610.1 hypothetical protein DF135_31820 [Burkholderia cepacia]
MRFVASDVRMKMQHSLYRVLSVTAFAWKLTAPAEREVMVKGASTIDIDRRIVQPAVGLRDGQCDDAIV